ncbi:hypothetical protein HU730_021935 [Pseudomonas sp. SWRI22]|uniref:hypothetical protein n=1 Tax=Pseudomonas sp. SWRI22 TaxID=2745513 RepID=UPI0016443C53|nr:hypothetical protein [Pseudomonas sp. SWRI22]MBV4512703.1 hypothetical protein [Pseudomonas sp. SWRI22]
MANQDLFKPSISLWQHYVTIISVAGMGLAVSFNSGWAAAMVIASFFAGAVVEGFAGARP